MEAAREERKIKERRGGWREGRHLFTSFVRVKEDLMTMRGTVHINYQGRNEQGYEQIKLLISKCNEGTK